MSRIAMVEATGTERFDDPIFNEREKAPLAFVRQTVKLVGVDDPTPTDCHSIMMTDDWSNSSTLSAFI